MGNNVTKKHFLTLLHLKSIDILKGLHVYYTCSIEVSTKDTKFHLNLKSTAIPASNLNHHQRQ